MFGEKEIKGEKIISIDDKNRIIIPKFTGVKVEDNLGVMYDLYKTKLLIYKLTEYEEKINTMIGYYDEKRKSGAITFREYLKFKRYIYAILSFPNAKAEKNNKLTLPTSAIKELSLTEKIYAVGKENHLELYSSKEEYEHLISK